MFKKLTVTLLTLTTIFSGISAYNTTRTAAEPVKAVSRQNSATETNNRKLDYSAEQDYSYADSFISDIVDWNTNGEELSLMTSDGYEFYSYKSADEYDFNKAYVALDDITDVEKEEGKIRIYTKDGSVYEIFGLIREN
ncbi:hypothetical protein DWX00_13035 [Blautia sp. AF17-9LB]|uniref:hypothetical protein n=1 Tax=Blautia sp. AF17-9LB TaxID=2292959 RepID=UPI000E52F507|nr:hypothetical protein [Blautia sp. AF17-9LB]RHR48695.1 hypothetical protein DWX00_13035 [Blautia sp. AF17-9LB]